MANVLSVSNLVTQVKDLLEGEFTSISVVGEISNLSRSSAGHIYFTLSDVDSGLSAVLFRADALRNPGVQKLRDGDKIICHGGLSVYSKRGTFQLIVRRFDYAGEGDLKLQFEKLKRELSAQGLFDQDQKKVLPSYARKIAIITAEGGAALQDFLNVFKRRALGGEVYIVPAVVQGENSATSLRQALAKVIRYHQNHPDKGFDVVVITRGGGSLEDLWSFNDEGLAWDIFNCPIPVVSAVGHQVDFTICDFVSDFRAETPTAAAEILTQAQTHVRTHMDKIKSQLTATAQELRFRMQVRLSRISPDSQTRILKMRLSELRARLRECYLDDKIMRMSGFEQKSLRLDDQAKRLEGLMERTTVNFKKRVDQQEKMLGALDPNRVLARGYSYVTVGESVVVSSVKSWKNSDAALLHLRDGTLKIRKDS